MIYVTRNPKDAANSLYNFINSGGKNTEDKIEWDDFFARFSSDRGKDQKYFFYLDMLTSIASKSDSIQS